MNVPAVDDKSLQIGNKIGYRFFLAISMVSDSIFLDLRLIWKNVLEKVAHHPESLLKKLRQVLLKVIIRSIKREKNCLMVIGQEVRKKKRKRNDQNQKRTTPEAKNLKFPRTSVRRLFVRETLTYYLKHPLLHWLFVNLTVT